MQIILHRVNTLAQLNNSNTDYGIEVDIRSDRERLIIHHDPFCDGEDFETWVAGYRHKTLILNVKEEGLEEKILSILDEHHISDFFFLDQSFPFLMKVSDAGEARCAVRVSEYESISTVRALKQRVHWVWADCFTRFPLDEQEVHLLQEEGFKICCVSPELQGREPKQGISELKLFFDQRNIVLDAVCTKFPELWES